MKELYRVVQPNSDEVVIEADDLSNNNLFKEEVINAIDYRYFDIDMELLEIMADYYIKHDLCESQLGMLIEKMEVKREEQKEVVEEKEMTPDIIEKTLLELPKFCSNHECNDCPIRKLCTNCFDPSPIYWELE